MNRIFPAIILVSVLTIFPFIVPAQSSDDTDGDGVKNSEDACPTLKGSVSGKGCPDEKVDQPKVSSASGSGSSLDSLKSNIDIMAAPKPSPTPRADVPRKKAPNAALSDCQFILDDKGCSKFFGRSESELTALFGKPHDNNSYTDLGLFFYVWGDRSAGVPDTVAEVTFYGDRNEAYKKFFGQPSSRIRWNATKEEVISVLGKPTEERSSVDRSNVQYANLSYSELLRLIFEDNKLIEITIRYDKHNADVAEYFVRLEEEKKRLNEQHLARLRQIQAEEDRKAQANKSLEQRLNEYRDARKANDGDSAAADEAKKQQDKLDSLKSNIDVFAPPTPKPTPSPTPSQAGQTSLSDKELDDLKSNIIFGKIAPEIAASNPAAGLDCKYILDFEKCRNVLFAMSSRDVLKKFGETKGEKFGMVAKYTYKGMIIDVANTDLVEEVEFKGYSMLDSDLRSPFTERVPAQDIGWGAGKDKIIKRFGKPQSETRMKGVDGQKLEHLWYDNDHLNFDFEDGKLIAINIKRKVSDDEYARMRQNLQRERDEIEARKTPAQRARDKAMEEARVIQYEFDRLHESLDLLQNRANTMIRGMSVTNPSKRYAQEKDVSLLRSEGIRMIEDLLKKYKGRLPANVIDHLSADIEKFRSGQGH